MNETNSLGLDYFSMTVYKCQDNVVLAYRGTGAMGFGEGKEPGEWLDNVVGYGILNYHSEEGKAKKYARKVARQYPNCKIYITGHSLGGYLAQIGAAEMMLNTSVTPERVVYFDGMGLNMDLGSLDGIFAVLKLARLAGRILHIDDTNALKNYYNGKDNEDEANLVLIRVKGDVVSALGKHYGYVKEFDPAPEHVSYIIQKQIDDIQNDSTIDTLRVMSFLNVTTMSAYFTYYSGKFELNSLMGYFEITHARPSFYYHLKQGRRGTGDKP